MMAVVAVRVNFKELYLKDFYYCNSRNILIRAINNKPCISSAKGTAYVKVYSKGKYYQYHNIVWECNNGPIPEGYTVDHVDRDKTNNHIDNLRLATKSEQQFNTKKYGTVSSKGVYFHRKNKKYIARIYVGGKNYHIGSYTTEEEAAKAYAEEAKIRHKEFLSNDLL
jgi:hypothetical protein